MNRITPEQVVEAYKATGLKPMQGDYFPREGCACALGVVAFRNGFQGNTKAARFCIDTFGKEYHWGFYKGFDGETIFDGFIWKRREKQGFEDGQAAWQAVVDAGLVEEADEDAVG